MTELISLWHGFFLLPFWGYLVLALVLTHITIVAVTLYLHRDQAHRSLRLGAPVRHFFRFWLWLTTGMITREWVAVHRKHHARCETRHDPHSPAVHGAIGVLWSGAELYRQEADNADTLLCYGTGTPDDTIERLLYTRWNMSGVVALLILETILLGLPGIALWALQMMWIPFFAAGIINGLGHHLGYRNFDTPDLSSNLSWFGLLIGGEELHNNHHAYPFSARFSLRRFEFDIGWMYVRLLRALGQATVLAEAPRLKVGTSRTDFDSHTVRALINGRIMILGHYVREVLIPSVLRETRLCTPVLRGPLKKLRRTLLSTEFRLDQKQLTWLLEQRPSLREVFDFHQRLQSVFRSRNQGHNTLRTLLSEWCSEAEDTGIEVLQKFAFRLRRYCPQPS